MPNRKSRPDVVRSLKGKWDKFYPQTSYLRSIAIGDGVPLRGITNSELRLDFPVTVVCGPNGTGKTTFLALATLAFHASSQPISISKKSKYYEFKDFFVPVNRDPQPAGIVIEWKYTDGTAERIKKAIKDG
ncbi:AAA family ATPase (plasmid) [Sinorhizobium meliloti]|nr:AAA family ATPase [Sinorhizobium meliloti]